MTKAFKNPMSHTTFFTLYDGQGVITRVVECSTNNVAPPPVRPGEFRVLGKGNCLTQKVVDGKVIDKSPAEMAALKKANPKLRFDQVGGPGG